MADDHKHNRADDLGGLNLEALLRTENDSSIRTLLLILTSLNANLLANTKTTEETSTKLSEHLVAFNRHVVENDTLINKGKGLWLIAPMILTALQLISGFAIVTLMDKITSMDKSVIALQISNARLEAMLRWPAPPTEQKK